jgi:hypothetical protein
MEVELTPNNKTVSVYISEELRKQAEEAGINLSATLREALEEKLALRAAIADALSDGVQEHEVELKDCTGVITGKFFGETGSGEQIFLTDDERVLVYNTHTALVEELSNPEAALSTRLQEGGDPEVLAPLMRALGLRPRVRL